MALVEGVLLVGIVALGLCSAAQNEMPACPLFDQTSSSGVPGSLKKCVSQLNFNEEDMAAMSQAKLGGKYVAKAKELVKKLCTKTDQIDDAVDCIDRTMTNACPNTMAYAKVFLDFSKLKEMMRYFCQHVDDFYSDANLQCMSNMDTTAVSAECARSAQSTMERIHKDDRIEKTMQLITCLAWDVAFSCVEKMLAVCGERIKTLTIEMVNILRPDNCKSAKMQLSYYSTAPRPEMIPTVLLITNMIAFFVM